MKICVLIFIISISFFSFSQIIFDAAVDGTTVNTCSSPMFDEGGSGGAGYGNDLLSTVTVEPNIPGKKMSCQFNSFNLNVTNDSGSPGITNIDYLKIYDGPNTSSALFGTYTGTQLAGSTITASNTNSSGSLTFTFYSNTIGTGVFNANLSCSAPCLNPIAGGLIVGGITPDSIRVCVGEDVVFQEQGSIAQAGFNITSYQWDFKDNTTSSSQNTTHSFATPGLYNVQLYVTDDNPDNVCSNNNLISLQVLVSTYPNFDSFPGDTSLCIGEAVIFSVTPSNLPVTWDGEPEVINITNGCLSDDLLNIPQTIDVVQNIFQVGSTITNVNEIQSICIDMEHTFIGDLIIKLICPNGQSAFLHQQGGGSLDLGEPVTTGDVDCAIPATQGVPYTYCFTANASETWETWDNNNPGSTALPAGDYLSVDPFSNFIGCPTNGTWTISVVDAWGGDDGVLFGFSLDLAGTLYANPVTFTPQVADGPTESFWSNSGSFITNLDANLDVVTITPTSSGLYNYVYSAINDFGCSFDTSVNVFVAPNPILLAGNDTTICNGAQFQLDGQVASALSTCDYSLVLSDTWGDGWNGNTITINVGGISTNYTLVTGLTQTFSISVVNGVNVTATLNLTGSFISEVSFTILNPSGNIVATQGPSLATGTVDVFTAACAPSYVFSWSPANQVSNATIADPMLQLTAPQTLTLSAHPPGHPACVVTDQIVIDFSPNPNAGTDGVLAICSNAAPVDLFTVLGAAPELGGAWLNEVNAPAVMPYNPMTMNAGTYSYVLNNGGCTDTSKVVVTEINTVITNSQVADVDCFGADNGSVMITGTNITSYKINNGASVMTSSPFTINSLAPGAYFIEVFGPSGCQDDININIEEPLPLQITSLTNDTTICLGQSLALSAAGAGGNGVYIYTWAQGLNPIGVGSPFNVTPITTTEYCVVLSEACGSLPAAECMTVTLANPIVNAVVTDKLNGCYPLTVNFTNTTATTDFESVRVDFGDGSSASFNTIGVFSHVYSTPGLYTVTMTTTSIFGCDYVTVFNNLIEAFDYPTASFTINPQKVSMFNPKVSLSSTSSADVVSVIWDIPSGNPSSSNLTDLYTVYPLDSVNDYFVTLYVTNEHGCKDSITNFIQVHEEVLLYAPNTFTPDGDKFNQTWKVFAVGLDPEKFELQLFNRWGEMVFHTKDVNEGWDAIYKGKEVQEGTFNWSVFAGNKYDDNKYIYRGSVNVIR